MDIINGDLSTLNYKTGMEFPRRVIRRGALTRHARAGATANQFFTVTATPTSDTDVIVGSKIFPAGGTVRIWLPPGTWTCLVNFNLVATTEETKLMTRTNNGPFTLVSGSLDLPTGVFMVQIANSTEFRAVDFAIRIGTLTATNVLVTNASISASAFRS